MTEQQGDLYDACIQEMLAYRDGHAKRGLAAAVDEIARVKKASVTTAEAIEARGFARGEARGRAEILIMQMTVLFGPLSEAVLARIRSADIDQLRAWTPRVFTATSIEEMLA
ncbi:hypothetical protein [Nocardia sp. NPDC051750]|uniref:hypothetical protein n=1 Tax=Nocardia sp. NPDC051750 TaxID=3364325 RepID=UPI00379BDF10